MNIHKLAREDFWALRRALVKLPWNEVECSPGIELLLKSINTNSEIGWSRLQQLVASDDDLLMKVMHENPLAMPVPEGKLINANELKNLTRPEYLTTDYAIYAGGFNALVGASGAKKSFIALDFGAKLACQMSAGHVVYIAAEGLNGYGSRWEAWKLHHRAETERLYFYRTEVNLTDGQQVDMFIEDISEYGPTMVIIDTVARCMPGLDENSTRDMGMFISQVDRIRNLLGCGILLVHHTGKDGKMRGSSALFAACDSVLFVQAMGDRVAVHNEHDKGGKNKYLKEFTSRFLALRPVDVQIGDETVSSAVLVDSSQIIMDDSELTSNQIMILDALDNISQDLTIAQLADMTDIPSSSLYRNIETLVRRNLVKRTIEGLYYLNKHPDSHDSHENPVGTRAHARDSHENDENQLSMFGKKNNGKKHQYTEGL